MKVRRLQLTNYRNYEHLDLTLSPNINIFIGNNAQGKTNVMEAIFYAAMGRSHRTHSEQELIRWKEEESRIALVFERVDVEQQLEFHFQRGKRRQIFYNGQKIRLKELMGSLNAVLFSPEDLFLIKGAPANRRAFLDDEISQASPAYYHAFRRYNQALIQRNTLLKRIREHRAKREFLEPWDVQLAECGAKIVEKRREAVQKLNMLANLMQRRISGHQESLSLHYEWAGAEEGLMTGDLVSWYNKKLNESVEMDILRGSTSIGPHRDDIEMMVNGINLRTYGSQGQQRTGALALKLSELEFLRSETGEYPILLLDDVMSELDVQRRTQLLQFIQREHIQTVITATDAAYFPKERMGSYYRVQAGKIMMG